MHRLQLAASGLLIFLDFCFQSSWRTKEESLLSPLADMLVLEEQCQENINSSYGINLHQTHNFLAADKSEIQSPVYTQSSFSCSSFTSFFPCIQTNPTLPLVSQKGEEKYRLRNDWVPREANDKVSQWNPKFMPDLSPAFLPGRTRLSCLFTMTAGKRPPLSTALPFTVLLVNRRFFTHLPAHDYEKIFKAFMWALFGSQLNHFRGEISARWPRNAKAAISDVNPFLKMIIQFKTLLSYQVPQHHT